MEGKQEDLDVDVVELDRENPRIRRFLEDYEGELTDDRIALALDVTADTGEEGAGATSPEKLRNSILANKGIMQPIIVNRVTGAGGERLVCIEGNSLLDFHDAQLCEDLASERPELLVALHLKNEPSSPWYNRLDLGGNQVSGLDRKASLRTMQKACRILTRRLKPRSAEEVARVAHDFWCAVALVLPEAFSKPRKSLVTKGVGVYALSELAADIALDCDTGARCDSAYFAAVLGEFAPLIDWSSEGPLAGLGGEGGARRAADILRQFRRRPKLKVSNG